MNRKKYKLILALVLCAGLIEVVAPNQICYADEIIKGNCCYTYGDNESLIEARELVRKLAIRNAIWSYSVFIECTSDVKNFQLINELLILISSRYLKDIEVMEHTEQGRTVCETVQASVHPTVIENVIKRTVKRERVREEIGLDESGYLKRIY